MPYLYTYLSINYYFMIAYQLLLLKAPCAKCIITRNHHVALYYYIVLN